MNDAVDRVIVERAALERGFPGGLILSGAAHALLLASIFVLPLILPKEPPLKVLDGFAVPLPPGGGGPANPEPPAPAPAAPEPAPQTLAPAPAPEPPKVLKPPTEAPPKNRLPEPDAKPAKKKPERVAEARPQLTDAERAYTRGAPTGAPRGTGRASTTPGLEFGPPGAGVPGGTDPFGDWYLAGVQRKIWTIWTQQIKGDLRQPIAVMFTILADGSVTDVRVAQSSGAALLDLAAQRAVSSAGPFGPLPKDYGTNRYTIQAIFKPVQ